MRTNKMKPGDIVRYTEKWSTPTERDLLHVILEYHDGTNTYLIQCINGYTKIPTQETVSPEMIEFAD